MQTISNFAVRGIPTVALLLGIFTAHAESPGDRGPIDESRIDEIVVIAHKVPRAASDIAANVTILSGANIDDMMSVSLADTFRYTPGIDHEASGNRFGAESINIRGIGGNRVAMLIDGVPISDQFDVGTFSNATRDFVNAGLIDRIEVLHGPASALYGSSAIGGVVAVSTPGPAKYLSKGNIGGNFSLLHRGADSSDHGVGVVALGNESRGLLLAGSIREGEETDSAAAGGAMDRRDFRRQSLLTNWTADDRFGNNWRVGYIYQASDVRSDLNSMLGTGRFRNTTAVEGDDEYALQMLNVSYNFSGLERWFDAGLVRSYYLKSETRQNTLDERGLAARPVSIDRLFDFEQELHGAEINLQKTLSGTAVEHKIGLGVELRRRDTKEYRDGLETGIDDGVQSNVLLGEVFPLRDFPISRSTEWGAYLEDAMAIADWSFIVAVRYDRYLLDPKQDAIYDEDFPFATPVSLTESDLSPKVGLVYHFSEAAEAYIQYTHGFRAPPYSDANIGLDLPLFNVRAIPNPALKSENSDGFDIGFRWRGERSNVRLALFRTHYTDFIESKRRIGTDPDTGRVLFQSQNLSRTVIEGIEGSGRLKLSGRMPNFAVDAAFYAAWGDNKDNGESLNSVGPPQLVAGIEWAPVERSFAARLQGTFTQRWSRRDETAGELFQPPGHAVIDVFLTRTIGDQITARLGLMNLTDRTYWRWSDVRGLSPSDPVLPYMAQAGRSIRVSLSKSWQ